jgi:hypothetical protein
MNWTLHGAKELPLKTGWRGDEIVVMRGNEVVDRLRAVEIERVTLIHAGEGESPGEVRAALFEMTGRVVVLGAVSGIAGRVLFERQAHWSQRNCIYWINEQRVRWPPARRESRWAFGHRVPQHLALAPAAAAAVLERSSATGPHTWDQRKQRRIERRRPFPGHVIGAAHSHSGALV